MIRIALKFGAFVLVCLFFTGYLAFTIGNLDVRDPLDRDAYKLTATFDDVTGLLPDDNVKISGVVVGKVTSVSTQGRQRRRRDEDRQRPRRAPKRSTTAAIRWRNLIGQRYVYLYPGETGGEALQDVPPSATLSVQNQPGLRLNRSAVFGGEHSWCSGRYRSRPGSAPRRSQPPFPLPEFQSLGS